LIIHWNSLLDPLAMTDSSSWVLHLLFYVFLYVPLNFFFTSILVCFMG
jgi:hypothetical protein